MNIALSETSLEQGEEKKSLFADLVRFFLVGAFFLALALVLKSEAARGFFQNVLEIRTMLQGWGGAGGAFGGAGVFLLAGGLAISLGMPRLWVSAVAGAIYGAAWGAVLALGSALLGAISVYVVGRSFLSPVVRRRIGGRIAVWKRRFRENAFWWVLYGRLFPFSNATLKSLLCGSCKVPFAPYLAGSFLGFIPLTLVFATFGSGGVRGNFLQVALGFGLLLAAFLGRILFKKISARKGLTDVAGEANLEPLS